MTKHRGSARSTVLFVVLGAAFGIHAWGGPTEPAMVRDALAAYSTEAVELVWNEQEKRPARIHGSFPSKEENLEAAAREFLRLRSNVLAIPPGTELELRHTRHGLVGTYLRFQQVVGDLPVFDSEIIVHVVSGEKPATIRDVNLAHAGVDRSPRRGREIGEGRARQIAERAVALQGELRAATEVVLGILAHPLPRLAYRVRMSPVSPMADWEVLVDAESGEVVSSRDRIFRATGTAQVFDPNPVASTGNTALVDNNDATNAALDAARFFVLLPRLDGTGVLRGSFVDARPPNLANRATNGSLQFTYNRTDDRFEEVMAYFHIDRVQQRIQATLGFTDVNNRVQVVVANGTTLDNSFYSSTTKQITTGSGGVDDAEDADVLVHEYGHSIQDNQVPGFGGGDEGAMGEGFGDYLAGSMEDELSPQITNASCIADWDAVSYATQSPPCLRRLDSTKHYPEFAVGETHTDGEMWSAALFRARSQLGADVMDSIVLESHFSLSTSETFYSAFAALVAADQTLYGGAHVTILRRTFIEQGLSRDLSAPASLPQVVSSDTVSIDNPRSSGLYGNLVDNTQTFTHPGAAGLRVHFAQFNTFNGSCAAGGCDNVYLTDAAGDLYQVLTGNLGAFDSVVIPGATVKIRLVTNGSGGAFGYHVDRIDVMGVAGASARPVPDGRFVLGTQLRGSRNGANVDTTWDVSSCTATNYNLYRGSIGNWTQITGGLCGMGTSGVAVGLPIPNNSWWVVAGVDGSFVSSFGRTGTGAEESFTGWGASGVCPAQTQQSFGATCP